MKNQKGEACAMFLIFTLMISLIVPPVAHKIEDIIDHKIDMEKSEMNEQGKNNIINKP